MEVPGASSRARFLGKDDSCKCELCPHGCALAEGKSGRCGVRFGGGKLPFYGFVTALAKDPIEKKPLYHFRPGSAILSVGFAGCNLRCPFCQNWRVSQSTAGPGRYIPPGELISLAKAEGSQIAYTYSEPLVHIEYLLDCMKEARKQKVANVLVTNGCANSGAAEEVLSLTDAANIDLKCFSPKTYTKVLGGDLAAVLNFIRIALEKGVHVELTTLVVPGLNDSAEELEACAEFIADLGKGQTIAGKSFVPWHLSAYHPEWKYRAPPTPEDFLEKTAATARKRLAFVYTGNIPGRANDTFCPHCGKLLISRRAYQVNVPGLLHGNSGGRCAFCGEKVNIREGF